MQRATILTELLPRPLAIGRTALAAVQAVDDERESQIEMGGNNSGTVVDGNSNIVHSTVNNLP